MRCWNGGSCGRLGRKTIATATQSFDHRVGVRNYRVELFAQVGDVGLDDVGMVLPVVVVEMLEEFLFAYDFARVMEQLFLDVVLGGREIDQNAAAMDGLFEGIEFDVEGLERRMRRAF